MLAPILFFLAGAILAWKASRQRPALWWLSAAFFVIGIVWLYQRSRTP
jgi:hypothetical protein